MNADEEIKDPNYNPEEEVVGCDYKIVDLPEITIESKEADEEVVFCAKSKLYRWTDDQWKERGVGELKIIKNKHSLIYRCFLRQEQTMKLRCMFDILGQKSWLPEKLMTSEKSWFWSCIDHSDPKSKLEKFCARFKTVEEYEKFQKEFLNAHEHNTKLAVEKMKGKKEESPKEEAKLEEHKEKETKTEETKNEEKKECVDKK